MSALEIFARAIRSGNLAQVDLMINDKSVDVCACLPRVHSPPALVYACKSDKLEIVRLLLRANASIDDADESGSTACHVAVAHGDEEMLLQLLLYGPNLAAKDSNGFSALEIAFRFGNYYIAQVLIDAGAPLDDVFSRLCSFAFTSTSRIESLLRRNVVVRDLVASNGEPILNVAVTNAIIRNKSDFAVLNMLVNVCGVDIDSHQISGFTSLIIAADQKSIGLLRWLVQANADVNYKCATSPLCNTRDYRCTVALLAAGALATQNALVNAINDGEYSIAGALLAAGADLDACDEYGVTPLHILQVRSIEIDANMVGQARQDIVPACGITLDAQVEQARQDIAKERLDYVRYRALQVCIGLESLGLPALQTCEILLFACGPVAPLIQFHHWWQIATTIKHFRK